MVGRGSSVSILVCTSVMLYSDYTDSQIILLYIAYFIHENRIQRITYSSWFCCQLTVNLSQKVQIQISLLCSRSSARFPGRLSARGLFPPQVWQVESGDTWNGILASQGKILPSLICFEKSCAFAACGFQMRAVNELGVFMWLQAVTSHNKPSYPATSRHIPLQAVISCYKPSQSSTSRHISVRNTFLHMSASHCYALTLDTHSSLPSHILDTLSSLRSRIRHLIIAWVSHWKTNNFQGLPFDK